MVAGLAVPVTQSLTEIPDVFRYRSCHCRYLGISLSLSLLQSYGSYHTYSYILLFNAVKKLSFALSHILRNILITIFHYDPYFTRFPCDPMNSFCPFKKFILGLPWRSSGFHASIAAGIGSTPGRETKILHAARCGQKNKVKVYF